MSETKEVAASDPLTEKGLGVDPIETCSHWLDEAYARSRMEHPNAVCLSTVGEDGWPQGRIVLVKAVDSRGLVFFTNYRSPKALALAHAPRAALTFYWPDLHRQVRVRGRVEEVSPEESDAYFRTRALGSQIGAWASDQSQILESREALEARRREIEERFQGGEVPRPDHWGGYLLRPDEIEFWQGRDDRLHDRFLFSRKDVKDEAGWGVQRLSP